MDAVAGARRSLLILTLEVPVHKAIREFFVPVILLVLTACATAGGTPEGEPRGRTRADLITQEELQRTQHTNLYDAVQTLRSRWLNSRGPDTLIGRQGEIQVHMDGTRLGGVSVLRSLPTVGVAYVQWFDPVSAAARWGLDHGNGAIYISSRPR